MEVPKNKTLIYYLSKMFLLGFNPVHYLLITDLSTLTDNLAYSYLPELLQKPGFHPPKALCLWYYCSHNQYSKFSSC